MTNDDLKKLEVRLKHQNDQIINNELNSLVSGDLLVLLDSKSRKVADTAAELLHNRDGATLLVDALLNNRIRTALGRLRATNVLNWFGRAVPEAMAACLLLLDDRSADVVDNALFGIVFARRRDLLPKLREHLARLPSSDRREEGFREAIAALEANDPSLFSPGFYDANNVWRLDEPAIGQPGDGGQKRGGEEA